MKDLIGKWAFVIGIIIAVLVGLFAGAISDNIALILMVLGLIIGLLNVTSKEATPFLLAGVSLLIATSFGSSAIPSAMVKNVLTAIMILVVPAVIVVALREVFAMAKSK